MRYRYRVTHILIAPHLELVFFLLLLLIIGIYLTKIIQLCLVLNGDLADRFLLL